MRYNCKLGGDTIPRFTRVEANDRMQPFLLRLKVITSRNNLFYLVAYHNIKDKTRGIFFLLGLIHLIDKSVALSLNHRLLNLMPLNKIHLLILKDHKREDSL